MSRDTPSALAVGLSVLLFFAAGARAQVCVSAAMPKSGDRGLILAPPGDPGFGKIPAGKYTVQIDSGPRIDVSGREGRLVLLQEEREREPHVFRAYRDDKVVDSFEFSLVAGEKKTCVNFRPLYGTWSVTYAPSYAACGCSGDG